MSWCALMTTRRGMGKDRGAVAIFTALALFFVIPGFAALAVDIGRYMSERQQLQNALDAGALAGAQFLPRNEELKAESVAREFALKNDPDLQGVPIDVSFGCLVTADQTAPTIANRTQVGALCNQYLNPNPNEPPLDFTCPGNGRCYRPCEFNNVDEDDGCNAITVSAKIAVPLILARAIPGQTMTRMEANLTSQACRGSQGSCGPPQDLDLVLLLDRSASIGLAFDQVALGAKSILEGNLNPDFHQVALGVTPTCAPKEYLQEGCRSHIEPFIKRELTTDYQSLIQVIEGLEVGGGTTDIATPIEQAKVLLQQAIPKHPDREVKKYIILLTDGAPNNLKITDECYEAVRQADIAKQNDIEIFTIGYFPGGKPSACQSPDFAGKNGAELLRTMAVKDNTPFQFSNCTAANEDDDNFYCQILGNDLQEVFNKIFADLLDDLGGSSLVDLSAYRSE